MSPDLKKCEAQALKLTPQDRAALAEHLIASLDTLDDAENERLWLEEADRRYQEYKKGKIQARSAKEVLRDARAAIG
jgi:putative addiction module component (TIGR02574 family)